MSNWRSLKDFLIVFADGTVADASTAYLVNTSLTSEKQDEILDCGTDQEKYELAQDIGYDLELNVPEKLQ